MRLWKNIGNKDVCIARLPEIRRKRTKEEVSYVFTLALYMNTSLAKKSVFTNCVKKEDKHNEKFTRSYIRSFFECKSLCVLRRRKRREHTVHMFLRSLLMQMQVSQRDLYSQHV